MDAAADARKQLGIVEDELRRERAAKGVTEQKLDTERRAVGDATAKRSGWVAKLLEPGADTTKFHGKIDELDRRITNSQRLIECLESNLKGIEQAIKVFEEDRARFREQIATAEREQEFIRWAAQGKQQVQDARQKLDDARASYGALSSLFEAGKQKFGPRAMFVLEQPLAELTREQSNPGFVGWRPVVGNMLNAVSILPMQR